MRFLAAILQGIWKAAAALPLIGLGVIAALCDKASQSQMPRPARKVAKRMGHLAAAKLVRRYADRLGRGRDLPDVKRLPRAHREYAEALSREDAARVSRLSSGQVGQEIAKRSPGKPDPPAEPQPKPSAMPSDIRKRIRERRRERGMQQRCRPEPYGPSPTLSPRP